MWYDTLSDPKVNGALILGCTKDCQAVVDTINGGNQHFVFNDEWDTEFDGKGTDRCGDGIMDGPISYTNSTTGQTIYI